MIELTVMPATRTESGAPQHDVRTALAWLSLEEGLEQAREQGKPVLCLAESYWSNSAQRLALFLEEDAQLKEVAAGGFIPVLVDPAEEPVLADRIMVAASQLEATLSPPLLAVLSEEGLPLVTYCNIAFEGDDERPSLLGLLRTTGEFYAQQPKECIVEARGLQQLSPAGRQAENLFLPAWSLLRQPDEGLLDSLLAAGIHDQLAGTFHRAARVSGWGVPHFEKSAIQNAAMANVLLDSQPELARECTRFALRCLEGGSAGLASDTPHYTWASSEVLESLPADELQLVGLHYRISASSSRHVLNQVRSVEETVSLATGSGPEAALEALARGKARLHSTRQQRPAPAELPAATRTARLLTLDQLLRLANRNPAVTEAAPLLTQLEHELNSAAPGGLHECVAAVQALQTAAAHQPLDWLNGATTVWRDAVSAFQHEGDWYYDRQHLEPVPAFVPDWTWPSVRHSLHELNREFQLS